MTASVLDRGPRLATPASLQATYILPIRRRRVDDIDELTAKVGKRFSAGKRFAIVVAAEGAKPRAGTMDFDEGGKDVYGHERFAGIARQLADELEQRLGKGGMGEIWRARSLSSGVEVAIKLLAPGLAGDPELVARFEREIANSQRIDHPNAVKVLGGGRSAEGRLYLVMEVLRGRSLSAVAATEAPLPPARVADLGRQIASGLGAVNLDPDGLATAHRVLVEVTQRANRLRGQP